MRDADLIKIENQFGDTSLYMFIQIPNCARLWRLVPTISSEGTMNIGPVLPLGCPAIYVAPIGDDAR
jgi:hypothetical protein